MLVLAHWAWLFILKIKKYEIGLAALENQLNTRSDIGRYITEDIIAVIIVVINLTIPKNIDPI